MAVEVLKSRGVPEDRILFLNVIASPEGVTRFASHFPKLRVVTAFVDKGLDEKKYEPLPGRATYRLADLMIAISFQVWETLGTGFTRCNQLLPRLGI